MPENTPKLFAHIQPAAPAQTDGSARVSGPAAPDRAGASAGCYTADSGEQELALLRQLLLNREIEGISDLRGRLNALAAKLGKLEYAEALSDP
ncbi:MAG: hypothetical protein LBM00_04690 [Deltaproteobacteria bacterium]|jgi:hypothetical protein|nr:hypothetical protein [Deltaproteobacteria bacterium]